LKKFSCFFRDAETPCFSGVFERKVSVVKHGFPALRRMRMKKRLKNTPKRPFQHTPKPTQNRPETPFNPQTPLCDQQKGRDAPIAPPSSYRVVMAV